MISLYIRPDKTQLMFAEVKKKNVIDVRMTKELPEAYSSFFMRDENLAIQKLRKMFRNVGEITQSKFEEVYVLLPDSLFSYVSCFEPSAEAVLKNRIMQEMNVDSLRDYFIIDPLEIKAPFPKPQKSIFVLKKKIVEMLSKAAQLELFSLVSVEPYSTAFIRGNQVWDSDYAIAEIFSNEATIVTFSPAGGIFRSDAPHMDANSLMADIVAGETAFIKAYALMKVAATKHFSSVSPDLKMILFSDESAIRNMHFVNENTYDKKFTLPNFVNASIRPQDIYKWLAFIGTFMQGFDDDDIVYPEKHSSIVVKNCNLLPPNMQANARARHWTKMAKRTLTGVAGVLAVVVLAETAAMMYFGSIKVDAGLKADADRAKVNISMIDSELEAIKRAKNENPEAMKAYDLLIKSRPKNCNFTSLKVGNKSGNFTANYIKLEAMSQDQMAFNNYIVNLQSDEFFKNPMISSIRNNKDILQADIIMGKAGAVNPAAKKNKKKEGGEGK